MQQHTTTETRTPVILPTSSGFWHQLDYAVTLRALIDGKYDDKFATVRKIARAAGKQNVSLVILSAYQDWCISHPKGAFDEFFSACDLKEIFAKY